MNCNYNKIFSISYLIAIAIVGFLYVGVYIWSEIKFKLDIGVWSWTYKKWCRGEIERPQNLK